MDGLTALDRRPADVQSGGIRTVHQGFFEALKPWHRRHQPPHVCTAQGLDCRLDRQRAANGQFSVGVRAIIEAAGNSLAQVIISDGSVMRRRRIRQSIGNDSMRAHAFRRTHKSLLGMPVETHGFIQPESLLVCSSRHQHHFVAVTRPAECKRFFQAPLSQSRASESRRRSPHSPP